MPDEFQGDAAESGRAAFSPAIALVTLSRGVEVRLGALLEARGLTLRTYGVLGDIASAPGVSLSDLARRSRISAQSVQLAVKALVEAGLVRSAPGPSPQAPQLTITATGSEVVTRLRAEISAFDAETFASPARAALAESLDEVTREGAS